MFRAVSVDILERLTRPHHGNLRDPMRHKENKQKTKTLYSKNIFLISTITRNQNNEANENRAILTRKLWF